MIDRVPQFECALQISPGHCTDTKFFEPHVTTGSQTGGTDDAMRGGGTDDGLFSELEQC